jgi:hypothetical protein
MLLVGMGKVTGLALDMYGCTLASGWVNSVVHLLDTPSGQVIRSLPHKAGVTHEQFIATQHQLFWIMTGGIQE